MTRCQQHRLWGPPRSTVMGAEVWAGPGRGQAFMMSTRRSSGGRVLRGLSSLSLVPLRSRSRRGGGRR